MDLEQMIPITQGDKRIELPLKNLLRLTLIYLRPIIDRIILKIAANDIQKYGLIKESWKEIEKVLLEELGVPKGGRVLL